jgi:hypothetical protein
MTYRLTATFERDLGDDLAVLNLTDADPSSPEVRAALVKQLVTELQLAHDNGIAGFFQITSITIDNHTTEVA